MSERKTFPDGTNHRRYEVRTDKGYWLATVFIGADGIFSAVSDYGDYGHWWRSIGCDDIRRFLCGCNSDYLVRKFAPETERDDEATVRAIKDCILELRRSKSLTAEQAREEWDLVENFDSPDVWYHETNLHQVTDVAELGRSRYKPQAVSFCEKVMPRLCEMLRAEMSLEDYVARVEAGQKWCTGCKEWHLRDAFGADASRSDGLAAQCLLRRKGLYGSTYVRKGRRSRAGLFLVPTRDGDKKQARARVNHAVDVGRLPDPNTLPCADCGHVYDGDKRHEYDHYLGYSAEHQMSVEPVCTGCHHRREAKRAA